MAKNILIEAPLIAKLPDSVDPLQGNDVPADLIGAKIHGFGTIDDKGERLVEGGGLVIDYQPAGESDLRRIVLAFSELGMWVHGDD